MTTSARVICLISPNGLGHYRRSIGLLDRLHDTLDVTTTVLCEDSQVERAAAWDRSRRFWQRPNVKRISGVLPGVTWPLSVDGGLLRWLDRLAELPELAAADLVLSDNLAGVLQHRSDAVLLGSFLWSDVLAAAYPELADVQAFVEHERALLARHRPPMLCVGDIAMPGVLERTDAVRLPWFCDQPAAPRPRANERKRVAVIGGATGAADAMLGRVVTTLAQRGEWELSSAPHLGAPHEFRFTAEEFAATDLVVCRPGIGTVTDCIAQRVPMLVMHESATNVELAHNGQRLAALGFARDLGAAPVERDVLHAVEETLDTDSLARIRAQLADAACDGFTRAIGYLVDRLGEQ